MRIYVFRLPRWLSRLLLMLRGREENGNLNKEVIAWN